MIEVQEQNYISSITVDGVDYIIVQDPDDRNGTIIYSKSEVKIIYDYM